MAVIGNFIFLFFRLMWEFLDLESECGGSICLSNNKIIDGNGAHLDSKEKILAVAQSCFISHHNRSLVLVFFSLVAQIRCFQWEEHLAFARASGLSIPSHETSPDALDLGPSGGPGVASSTVRSDGPSALSKQHAGTGLPAQQKSRRFWIRQRPSSVKPAS